MSSHLSPLGSNAVPERAMYPQDKIVATEATQSFRGEVRAVEDSHATGHSIHEIDGAVRVESVDGKTRQEVLNVFGRIKDDAVHEKEFNQTISHYNIAEIGTGIGAMGLGLALGVATAAIVPAIFAGIAGVFFTIDGIRRYRNTSENIDAVDADLESLNPAERAWQDPLPKIVEQRIQAGDQGFVFVHTKDLKGTVVHPDEVTTLWTKSFQRLLSDHADIDTVYREDILGQGSLAYAYGHHSEVPFGPGTRIGHMAEKYSQWKHAYETAESYKNNALSSLRSKQRQAEDELSAICRRWLLPAERTYHLGKENSLYHYNEAIRPYRLERDQAINEARRICAHSQVNMTTWLRETISRINYEFNHHPEVRQVEASYAYENRMHSFLYQQSKDLVNAHFDNRKRDLTREVSLAESQILSQHQSNRGKLKDLLNHVIEPRDDSLVPSDYRVEPIYQNISFAGLMIEPTWNQIYGMRPQYHHDYSTNVLQEDWNLFWGPQGIGTFASRPANGWDQVQREHLFQRRYPVRRAPPTGLFAQHVIVPRHEESFTTSRVVPGTTTVQYHPPRQVVRPAPAPAPMPAPAPAPRVVPGQNNPAAFGGTVRRPEPRPAPAPVPRPGQHTQTAFGGTVRRPEPRPAPAPAPRVEPGMHRQTAFGRGVRR